MESFCHVGGRQGNHPQYGQNCVVLAKPLAKREVFIVLF